MDLKEHHRKARNLYWWSQCLIWGGLLFLAIDLTTEFPTPKAGEFAVPTLVVMVCGFVLYLKSQRLPLTQVLQLASDRGGRLTLSEITTELQVDLRTAELCIEVLKRKSLARTAMSVEQDLLIFPEFFKPPDAQVLRLARARAGLVTIAMLREELQLDPATAEETLRGLEMQGYLRRTQEDGAAEWKLAKGPNDELQ